MAKPKQLFLGSESEGICVRYIKSRKTLDIYGWFDHVCGIKGQEIPLEEFCQKLGIELDKNKCASST